MNHAIWKWTPAAVCAAALLVACSQEPQAEKAEAEAEVEAEAVQTEPASPLEAGKAFLAKNGQREGVTTTASGLQYEVLVSGDGPSPISTDTVTAHYHGTLIDGTMFDSSREANKPFTTQVGGVIKGWQEVLQLMRVGDKWKVFIPPELAYGEQGAGTRIGPHETLIFEMELLAIEGQASADADAPAEDADAPAEADAPEDAQEGT